MDIEKEFFNYIVEFVNDLTKLNVDGKIKMGLNAIALFLRTTTNIRSVTYPMNNFIMNSKFEISTENDIIFRNFDAKTGEIRTILNLINEIWDKVTNPDKKVIWDWMKFFLEFTTVNQSFLLNKCSK